MSHQTVSRFLNWPTAVKPDTRARIALAIWQLGYRGNLAARMLATVAAARSASSRRR